MKALFRSRLALLGVLISLSAGGANYYYVSSNRQEPVQTQAVVLAAQEIAPQTKLTNENIPTLFRVVSMTLESVPAEAFATIDEIPRNAVVMQRIPKMVPVVKAHFAKVVVADNRNGLSFNENIPEGKVAIALQLSDIGTVASAIQVSDHVDLAVSFQSKLVTEDPAATAAGGARPTPTPTPRPGASNAPTVMKPVILPDGTVVPPGRFTKLLLQDLVVINVGSNQAPDPKAAGAAAAAPASQTIITFAVTREEAVLLKYLRDEGATFDLFLRPVNDGKKDMEPLITAESALQRILR